MSLNNLPLNASATGSSTQAGSVNLSAKKVVAGMGEDDFNTFFDKYIADQCYFRPVPAATVGDAANNAKAVGLKPIHAAQPSPIAVSDQTIQELRNRASTLSNLWGEFQAKHFPGRLQVIPSTSQSPQPYTNLLHLSLELISFFNQLCFPCSGLNPISNATISMSPELNSLMQFTRETPNLEARAQLRSDRLAYWSNFDLPTQKKLIAELATLINSENNIPHEMQELFWRDMDPKLQQAVIVEQKDKYGTMEFTHDKMLRIVTEKTREWYIEKIKAASPDFEAAGLKFLGLGFGGAAFRVTIPEGVKEGVPEYVLKVPVAIPRVTKSLSRSDGLEPFASLKDEYDELRKLTKFSENFERDFKKLKGCPENFQDGTKQRDTFSQKLAGCWGTDGKWHYLGQNNDDAPSVLATVYQQGFNIYEDALNANRDRLLVSRGVNTDDAEAQNRLQEAKQRRQERRARPNPFVTEKLADFEIVKLVFYHLGLTERGINFYDLFLHNAHYLPGKRSLSFVDSWSTPEKKVKHQKLVEARRAFPIDTCIYDLMSFLALQEMKQPYAITVRTDSRQTIENLFSEGIRKELTTPNTKDLEKTLKDRLNKKYREYLDEKLNQLKNCLEQAIDQLGDKFTLQKVNEALARLTDFDKLESHYGTHYGALIPDFSKITPRGKEYLKQLRDHFQNLAKT